MIKEDLLEITVTPVARGRQINFIRMGGVVIGTVANRDGSRVNLHREYDQVTVKHIRDGLCRLMTNRLGGTSMLKPVPEELLKQHRANDENDDLDS